MQGRIGILTAEESNSASIEWRKEGERTHIRISGMLGQTYARLSKGPEGAKVELSDQTYTGTNAQQLLYRTTGWNIPVDQLEQWILGIYTSNANYQNNTDGYVEHIYFDQWHMQFRTYKDFAGLIMPKKLRVTHPEVTIKFSVHDWQFTKES